MARKPHVTPNVEAKYVRPDGSIDWAQKYMDEGVACEGCSIDPSTGERSDRGFWADFDFDDEPAEGDEMTLSTDTLERRWSNLLVAVKEPKFAGFSAPGYFQQEFYKYAIYDNAREELGTRSWEPEDVGTGKIQKAVSSAAVTTVREGSKSVTNNLVDWRQTSTFKERAPSHALETLLYNFFKSKISDQLAFEGLLLEKVPYQFIAYLFFVKDKNQFSPISQQIFDLAFQLLGLDFKTSGMGSWENYHQYCDFLKQVRDFLKTKDTKATLLDAHSFIFVLGFRAQRDMDGPVHVPQQVEPPASQAGRAAVSRSVLPRAQAADDKVTVLKAGGESGSITLSRAHLGVKGLQFTMHTEDLISGEHGEHGLSSSQCPPVATWKEALALLDRFGWAGLHPLAVHEDFRGQVWAAVKQRTASPDGDEHSGRSDWHRLCFPESG